MYKIHLLLIGLLLQCQSPSIPTEREVPPGGYPHQLTQLAYTGRISSNHFSDTVVDAAGNA